MCDIPTPPSPGDDGCASQADIDSGLNYPLTQAAVLLAIKQSSSAALDYSTSATGACGGFPKKITFLGGHFPDGATACINCGKRIPVPYKTSTKACIAKCKDLVIANGVIPAEGTDAYCEANAHTSTNYDKDMCDPRFKNFCTSGGNQAGVDDPRRTPEAVIWIDGIGTDDGGGTNTLTRSAVTSPTPDFDAGAASLQTILSGDGWVDFSVTETDLSHVVWVRHSCKDPVNVCPDTVPGLDDIGFMLSLNNDGQVYVLDSGPPLTATPFGTYAVGERFRVKFVDNHDGTATISYARVVGACPDGTLCTEDPFGAAAIASYPLRVDASFREQNATLADVRLVRIISQ